MEQVFNREYSNFRGLFDKDDSGLIPSDPETGVFASSILNVTCNDGTITMGNGYEAENDGSSLTTHYNSDDNTYIRGQYRLKRRDGEVIIISHLNNGKLEWLNTTLNRYETLTTALTASVDVGMIDFNKTDQDRTYYGDGINNLSFWNKAIAYYASDDGSNVITATVPNSAHTTLALAGFSSSGSITFKDGTTVTYSGLSGMTFTGCSALPTTPTVGDGIAEAVDTTTLSTQPKGRIFAKYQGRLVIVLHASPTLVHLSVVGDGTDFTTTGVSGRIILNVIDGDGAITNVQSFKKRLIVFKEGGIIPVQIIQVDATTLRSTIEPLVEYPNVGPTNPQQVFVGLDEIYWISDAEKDIKKLSKVKSDTDLDLKAERLTEDIRNTLDDFDLSNSRLIVNKRNLYISAQSSDTFDTTIQYDVDKKTFYIHNNPFRSFWLDSSNDLHATDTNEIQSYLMNSGLDANSGDVSYLWKSGRLNMGTNYYKKSTNTMAIFGRMTKSSEFTTQLDYNNGSLTSFDFILKGDGSSNDDGTYMFLVDPAAAYGNFPYGLKPYGGEVTGTSLQYFLAFKTLPKNFRPYDVFASFAAQGSFNHVKILSFAFNPTVKGEISKKRKV